MSGGENGGEGPGDLIKWRLKELEKSRDDHEKRISNLEGWRRWILGGASAIMLTIGAFSREAWDVITGRPS